MISFLFYLRSESTDSLYLFEGVLLQFSIFFPIQLSFFTIFYHNIINFFCWNYRTLHINIWGLRIKSFWGALNQIKTFRCNWIFEYTRRLRALAWKAAFSIIINQQRNWTFGRFLIKFFTIFLSENSFSAANNRI